MPAIRQYAASGRGGGGLTLPSAPIAGNRIVFAVGARSGNVGAGQIPTIGEYTQHGTLWTGQNGVDVYSKVADGTEAADLVGIGNQAAGVFIELDGPFALRGILTGTATGGGHPVAGPVDAVAGDFALAITVQGHGGAWDSGAGGITYTPDAGWTEVLDAYVSGGGHPNTWAGYQDVTVDGPVSGGATCSATPDFGPGTFTWGAIVAVFEGDPVPPEPGAVLDVYDQDDVFLATLPAFDVRIRPELNGVGSGAFRINRYAAEATAAILKRGNYVRVTIPQIDPAPIFGFFLDEGDFRLVASDEEGGEDIGFQGHGPLSYWARAIWLAESFLVPWWPASLGTPPSTAIGAISVRAGKYQHWTVSGTSATGWSWMTTGGFSAYYDRRRKYTRADGTSIWLIRLSTGAYSGRYLTPYGAGKTLYPKRSSYTLRDSVLMESIDDGDKPGQVVRAMYDEAFSADRPINPIPLMTVDFDATLDSDGNAWTITDALRGVSADLGDDYLSTIGKLVETGALDVEMGPDLDMHAYNERGRDLTGAAFGTGVVRFVKGVNIADELVREQNDDRPVGTFAEVLGPNEGDVGRATLPTAAEYRPREISVRGESSDPEVLEELGLAELESRLRSSDTVAFNVATPTIGAEDDDAGLYVPGPPGSARGRFWPGDYVRLHSGTGENDFDEVDLRVAAVTIWFNDAGDLRVAVELGSSLGGLAILGYPASRGGVGSGSRSGGGSGTSDYLQLTSERDQPNGYPSLDELGRVGFGELDVDWRKSVRVVATTPATISTAYVPGQVVDGVTLAEGDDILIAWTGGDPENGIRTVGASGAPTRRADMVNDEDVVGAAVLVREGTAYARTIWLAGNLTDPDLEVDDVVFEELEVAGASTPAEDTVVWMPLTTVVGGAPELVWDADDSLVPTLTPI